MSTETTPDPGPFLIDGPDYSDRDREMFVLGYEFARIVDHVAKRRSKSILIHPANMIRARDVARGVGLAHWFGTDEGSGWLEFGLGTRP